MWPRAQFRKVNTMMRQEKLNAPDPRTGQRTGHPFCHGACLVKIFLTDRNRLPAFLVITSFLPVPYRWTEKGFPIFLRDRKQGDLCMERNKLFNDHFVYIAS